MPALPKVWREVRDDLTGDLLYWRREHSGYQVHPEYGQFRSELDGKPLSLWPTLTHAIVACRDHMHQVSTTAAARGNGE